MMSSKLLLVTALFLFGSMQGLQAQQTGDTAQSLNFRHQSIATISALTAVGDLEQLKDAFSDGLDAELSVNEIREVLVHLSAYCGFPRSLQGINTFMAVLDARKAKGIKDKVGREATLVQSNLSKYEQGKKTLELLTGQPEREPKTGYAAFAPVIDTFLKEHLFADIFGRDILNYTDREIATVAALVSLGGVEPMLRGHIGIALRLGVTEAAMRQMLSLVEARVGKEEADAGRRVLSAITNSAVAPGSVETAEGKKNIYAKGTKAPATNFTGAVWVNMIMLPQEGLSNSIGVVTFEPKARSAWHRHPGGQILLVTEGKGYYQERGQKIRLMQKGDILKCPPGVEHWHGASPESTVTHIAISPNSEKGSAVWLQKVTDQEYGSFK
jgi:4-carboxymuconolactone decarboxylase